MVGWDGKNPPEGSKRFIRRRRNTKERGQWRHCQDFHAKVGDNDGDSVGDGKGTVRTSTPRLVMACLLPRMMYIMYFYLPSKTNGAVAAKKDLQKDAEVTFCFVFGIFLLMLDCRSI